MTESVEQRYCPVCARTVYSLYCPEDGAVTIARKRKKGSLPLKIGDQVDSRYRVARVIGRGGFGVVYAARHLVSGQELAIKVLCDNPQGDLEEAIARFHKEARVLARLRHPNTVRVYDVGYTEKGNLYIAMELLRGPNLEQVFAEMGSRGATMNEAQILDVVIPVLGSLGEAHRLGLVHRDMKPANIALVQVPDEPFQVKVLDFGVVRTADSSLTRNQTALGTPAYMSPEQCRSVDLDGRSDLYAVGCLMYEATCGASPYHARSPVRVMYQQMESPIPNLRENSKTRHSEAYVAALRKVMSKDPEDRFADAREMRHALQQIRATEWGDVPLTPLTGLISEHALRRSKSLWRIVVGEDEARPRATQRGQAATSDPIGSRQPTEHSLPTFNASTSPTQRGVAVPTRPSDAIAVDDVAEGALTGLPWSEPQLMVPEGGSEDPEAGSQDAVRLPNLSIIEDAIRRREEQLAKQALAEAASPTLHEVDPSHGSSKERTLRVPQVAPPSAEDVTRPKRNRKADFGKGTLIGTGFKSDGDKTGDPNP